MKRFTEVSMRRWRAELCRTRSLIKDDRTPTGRGLLFALVADELDLFFGRKEARKSKKVLALQGQRLIHSVRKYCLFALYVVTPDPANQTGTVHQHSVLRVNHEYHIYL